MASWQAHFVSLLLRTTFKPRLAKALEATEARRLLESGAGHKVPDDLDVQPGEVAGIAGEWVVRHGTAPRPTLLHLHGGGYFACSARTHRPYTCFFAAHGFRVFAPNYRLAPEHPFPAAIDDAQQVYLSLVEALGGAGALVVTGDSAGGGLTLALMQRLREAGQPLPAAIALFSPWTDLATTGPSAIENEASCSMFVSEAIRRGAAGYLDGADALHPHASPLYADMRGLPPMLVHAAEREAMRDDSTRLVERARAAGVAVEFRLWPVVHHDWQMFQPFIPEARESLTIASEFLLSHVATNGTADAAPAEAPRQPIAQGAAPDVEVCIVGSGFSGLGMAIQLERSGIGSFRVLEQAGEIGGTWRDNTYPGCACDIPSHLYSLSFAPKTDWSRMYPTQPEIRAYLHDCVARFGLADRIRLNTRLDSAAYDETSGLWKVQTSTGSFSARFLVSAIGGLHRPAIPALPGIESFAGPTFHSSRWDHGLDLAGKHVAVIGTGASAIQFVPQIAAQVAHLDLYQRTAPWVLPKLDRAIGPREQWALRHVPLFRTLCRWRLYWRQELFAFGFTLKPQLLDRARKMGLWLLRKQVPSESMRAQLTPDYQPGCKRILISNDYFPTLAQSHVKLVTAGIRAIRPHGVLADDGVERRADVIIYGTGFQATDTLGPLRVTGRGGARLDEMWRGGMHAYYGTTVPRFPNFFMVSGPNTGLGHNSVIFMFEAQIGYVLECITTMRRQGLRTLEVRAHVEADHNEAVQRRLRRTVWSTGCKSWYLDANGRNVTLWPGFTFDYWRRLRHVDWRAYRTESTPA
jgi:cation diffusion facilitator CzcD-associated flavoprotein CzcO/acetyl esterase/lipase